MTHRRKKRLPKHQIMPLIAACLIAGIGSYLVSHSFASSGQDSVNIRIATYNILGSGANAAPEFNRRHNTNTYERAQAAISTIDDYDIVGLQEVDFYHEKQFDKTQFQMFKDGLANKYNIFPTSSPNSANRSLNFDKASMRAIVWKKDKYRLIGSGRISYPYQNAPRKANGDFENNDKAPWVLLQDRKHPSIKFYVVNVHLVAYNTDRCRWNCNPPGEKGGSDKFGDLKRKAAAEIFRAWAQQHKSNHPILMTGDFNSGVQLRAPKASPVTRRALPYCILTNYEHNTKVFYNTMDAYYKRSGTCPTSDKKYQIIDQIYATQAFTLERWGKRNSSQISKASDHRPTFAVVSLKLPKVPTPNVETPEVPEPEVPVTPEVPTEPTEPIPTEPTDPDNPSPVEPPIDSTLKYFAPDSPALFDD